MTFQEIEIYAIAVAGGVIVPLFLARYVARANWLAVTAAYLAWPVFLYRLLNGRWSIDREAILWTVGFALYSSWLAVPILAMLSTAAAKAAMAVREADQKYEDR